MIHSLAIVKEDYHNKKGETLPAYVANCQSSLALLIHIITATKSVEIIA
jgi:hypothetical protein